MGRLAAMLMLMVDGSGRRGDDLTTFGRSGYPRHRFCHHATAIGRWCAGRNEFIWMTGYVGQPDLQIGAVTDTGADRRDRLYRVIAARTSHHRRHAAKQAG